jgi:sec-independent protein translocase protein TatC
MLGFEIFWSGDRYYALLVWMVMGMALCFQFPLVLYLLVYLRVVSTAMLRKSRRYMIVLFFFLGALLTPTWDPFTQSMVALPMWLMFEISLWLATKTEIKRTKEMEMILGNDDDDEYEG